MSLRLCRYVASLNKALLTTDDTFPYSAFKIVSHSRRHLSCPPGFVPPSPPQCMDALGMQSGRIKPDAVQASSQWDSNHGPDNARLHFQKTDSRVGAWCVATSNANQWIQARFDVVAKVRRVAIQGRMDHDQWVKTYTLAYSFDGKTWKDYELNGKVTVCV